jgi:hypothetical protein
MDPIVARRIQFLLNGSNCCWTVPIVARRVLKVCVVVVLKVNLVINFGLSQAKQQVKSLNLTSVN